MLRVNVSKALSFPKWGEEQVPCGRKGSIRVRALGSHAQKTSQCCSPLPLSHSQSPGSQNYRSERTGRLSLSWRERAKDPWTVPGVSR